ncbi:protein serine/threonine phosphatase 2C [Trametes sanguinea]|nr:protein serine/threonine phosphatase 2C [Trametes sanguinea]
MRRRRAKIISVSFRSLAAFDYGYPGLSGNSVTLLLPDASAAAGSAGLLTICGTRPVLVGNPLCAPLPDVCMSPEPAREGRGRSPGNAAAASRARSLMSISSSTSSRIMGAVIQCHDARRSDGMGKKKKRARRFLRTEEQLPAARATDIRPAGSAPDPSAPHPRPAFLKFRTGPERWDSLIPESQVQHALDEVKDFATTDMDRGGPERWTYRMLQEPALTEELKRLAQPQTIGRTDAVTLQPCRSWHYRSQDRYKVEEWVLPGGIWTYAAVFDGHMNFDTVEHISAALGPYVKSSLAAALRSRHTPSALPKLVSGILEQSLSHIDSALVSDFLAIFPSAEPEALRRHDPSRIKQLLNDTSSENAGYLRTARAFGGTTALVTLADPTKSHLWVANVGDCIAVMGEKDAAGNWRGTVINSIHNGSNPGELERIRSEHPEETDCTWNDRVLGFLAPTRAIGDAWLKLPAVYAELVFKHLEADWLSAEVMEAHVPRIRTPPYLSSTPDVYHIPLRNHNAQTSGAETSPRILILCSDGLSDLYDGYSFQDMAEEWTQLVGRVLDSKPGPGTERTNLALSLLREAIGGSDTQLVSRNLTVEMEERWMDDTTIVVQRLP